jgi:hypothetical protein
MHVGAVVPNYPPHSLVGSWLTTHEFLRHLVTRGHQVRVSTYRGHHPPLIHDGVRVVADQHCRRVGRPDVIVGHAGDDGSAAIVAEREGVPLVLMVHGGDPAMLRTRLEPAALARQVAWSGPSVVLSPPVDPARFATAPGDAVTLVNLSAAKGGAVFWTLAGAMPERKFLGVRGSYHPQLMHFNYGNVQVMRPTQHMATDVYARTRVLLMPSLHETFGRVALEAAASGIPTIAHPTAGLRESMGPNAATYVERDDLDGWCQALRHLDHPETYRKAAERARRRAARYRWQDQLDGFTTAIESLADVCRDVTPERAS